MNTAVSIIVPLYNVERFLRPCLESICSQTLSNIQIICVDDGSTDASPQIVDELAAADERILAIHKPNTGYGDSLNCGIAQANGEYIGIVESDDWVDPAMFETLYDAAVRHNQPDVVKGAYWRVCNADTPEQEMLPANYLHRVKYVDQPFTIDQDGELLYHHPSIWSAIYRAGFLEERGIAFPAIPGAGWADNPFLIETLVQAAPMVYIDEPLYYYREFNVGSSSIVSDPSIISDRWLEMDAIIKRLGVSAPQVLQGHYNRGCAYIEMLEGFPGNQQALAGIKSIAQRMDYNAILQSSTIAQSFKDVYQSHVPAAKRLAYKVARRFGR